MVAASRKHLTERYASGVDLLLWETEKRLIPDLDAIKAVAGAVSPAQAADRAAETARRAVQRAGAEHAAQSAAGDDTGEQLP